MTTCSPLSLFQKGDLLLKVNESSLDKFTHSKAVYNLCLHASPYVYLHLPMSTCSSLMTTCDPLSLFQKVELLLKVNDSSPV
jgi:hypothetical protein